MHMMNDEVSGFVIVRLYLTQKAFAVVAVFTGYKATLLCLLLVVATVATRSISHFISILLMILLTKQRRASSCEGRKSKRPFFDVLLKNIIFGITSVIDPDSR